MTGNVFSKELILKCEQEILLALGFDFIHVSSLDALEALAKRWNYSKDQAEIVTAKNILLLFLLHHFHDSLKPFKLSAFALALSCSLN